MRSRRLVLVVLFAALALGVAGVLIARSHATAGVAPAPALLHEASAPGDDWCPGGCPTISVCTEEHQKCECPRGKGRCTACPDGTFICVLQ